MKQRHAARSSPLTMQECNSVKTKTFPMNFSERRLVSAAELEEIARRTIPLVPERERRAFSIFMIGW
jgi:hypothetical protein